MSFSNRTLTTAGVVAVASAAAFFAGRITAPPSTNGGAVGISERAVATKASARGDAATPRRLADRSGTREKTRGKGTIAKMEELLRGTDPTERSRAWLDFVNSLDPAEFESVVTSLRALKETSSFNNVFSVQTEYEVLLSAWSKQDPLRAFDYAQANTIINDLRNETRDTIISTWASYDPDAAIKWAGQNYKAEEGDGNPWMIGVIKSLATTDPARASQLLAAMPDSWARTASLNALTQSILAQGPDAARAYAESFADEDLKQGAISQIAPAMAAMDPAGTAELLMNNPGKVADDAIGKVISSWMKTDPDSAVACYQSLPPGKMRSNALISVAKSIAEKDPLAAADFVDANAADANNSVYADLGELLSVSAPESAASYIGRIANPETRERMYESTLRRWLYRDFDAATTWINGNAVPENVQLSLQEQIDEIQESGQ